VTHSGISPEFRTNFPFPKISRLSLTSKRRDATATSRGSTSVPIQTHTHRAAQSDEINETEERFVSYRRDFLSTFPVHDSSLHRWPRGNIYQDVFRETGILYSSFLGKSLIVRENLCDNSSHEIFVWELKCEI
jgi:hypothetical protein